MHATPFRRFIIPTVVGASTLFTFTLPVILAGCGSTPLEVDKAALYTPESLASELAYRFRALSPDARIASNRIKPRTDKGAAERLERAEKIEKKGGGSVKKKQAAGPRTVDDLLDDIDNKLGLLRGISRSDACRKMIDTLSQDASLTDGDKKSLTELVGKLADGR